jgi:hypothetical protein
VGKTLKNSKKNKRENSGKSPLGIKKEKGKPSDLEIQKELSL